MHGRYVKTQKQISFATFLESNTSAKTTVASFILE